MASSTAASVRARTEGMRRLDHVKWRKEPLGTWSLWQNHGGGSRCKAQLEGTAWREVHSLPHFVNDTIMTHNVHCSRKAPRKEGPRTQDSGAQEDELEDERKMELWPHVVVAGWGRSVLS
jgi:hypothetical protein